MTRPVVDRAGLAMAFEQGTGHPASASVLLQEGWLNLTWGSDIVRAETNARGYCPVAFLALTTRWHTRIHDMGISRLPTLRISPTDAKDLWFDPVMILDPGQRYLASDSLTWHCEATWTTGGRTVKTGHLAWTTVTEDYATKIEMWAVSTREDLAIKRCQSRVINLKAHQKRKREIELEEQLEEQRIAIAQDADLIASIVI